MGNMVLGDTNLPDGLLFERIRSIVIISAFSTVIGIQVVDLAVGVVYGVCRHCAGVSGKPLRVMIETTGGRGTENEVNYMHDVQSSKHHTWLYIWHIFSFHGCTHQSEGFLFTLKL